MPTSKTKPEIETCGPAWSWGRKHAKHAVGEIPNIYCFKCGKRMGCSVCCEPARELFCVYCQSWATKLALSVHGRLVKDAEQKDEAMKIVIMRLKGRIDDDEAAQLFKELWG